MGAMYCMCIACMFVERIPGSIALHVCIACMFVERIHGSIVLCYVQSIDDFLYLWLGQISIVEAGAITSILFSSWAGADHSAPC